MPFKVCFQDHSPSIAWGLVRNADSQLASGAPGPDSALPRAKPEQLYSKQRTRPRSTRRCAFPRCLSWLVFLKCWTPHGLCLFAVTLEGYLLHLIGKPSLVAEAECSHKHPVTPCSLHSWVPCSLCWLAALAAHQNHLRAPNTAWARPRLRLVCRNLG